MIFFSAAPELSLLSTPKVIFPISIEVWTDELLSAAKITAFPAKPLPKPHTSSLSNTIPQPL